MSSTEAPSSVRDPFDFETTAFDDSTTLHTTSACIDWPDGPPFPRLVRTRARRLCRGCMPTLAAMRDVYEATAPGPATKVVYARGGGTAWQAVEVMLSAGAHVRLEHDPDKHDEVVAACDTRTVAVLDAASHRINFDVVGILVGSLGDPTSAAAVVEAVAALLPPLPKSFDLDGAFAAAVATVST